MPQKILRLIFWSTLVLFLVVSSIPDDTVNQALQSEELDFRLDYVLHFIAYLIIGSLAAMAYKPNIRLFLLLVLFAVAEEGHQYWIPGRSMNPVDFLYDVLGITVGLTGIYLFKRLSQKR